MLAAVALNPLNSTMLATAIASIERDYPDASSAGAWLVAVLYLASAISQPVLGNIADRLGARRLLVAGLVVVGIGGVLGYVVAEFRMLLAARVIIAIGTAAAYPAVLTLVQMKAKEQGGFPPPARWRDFQSR